MEIHTEIELKSAKSVTLEIKSAAADATSIVVAFDGAQLRVMDAVAPLHLKLRDPKLSLRIFMDRSVLEVFANETVCITRTITPLAADASLKIRAEGDGVDAKVVEAWPLKSIW